MGNGSQEYWLKFEFLIYDTWSDESIIMLIFIT